LAAFISQGQQRNTNPQEVDFGYTNLTLNHRAEVEPPLNVRSIVVGKPFFEINLGVASFWISYRMADMSTLDSAILGLAVASYGCKAFRFSPLGVGALVRYRFTPAIEGALGYDDRGRILQLRVAL